MPTRIGKYDVIERIGRGGFGDVFLAQDRVIKRPVAIKVCTSAEAHLRQRFFREAEIAGRLQHPNITTIHDTGSLDETPYLVQEYLPGEDLIQHIKGRYPTPLKQRLNYLIQIARGLVYAHQQGVVHRDIKPSNIRLLSDGTVKILDFGVARLLNAKKRLTLTGTRIGTVCYMAPEQLRGQPADARADLFSFGVVAFELLTSVHPFKAAGGHAMMYQILEFDPTPLRKLWPGCPRPLARCVMRCLAKKAEDRFADMSEVLAELERVEIKAPRVIPETQITMVRSAPPLPRRSGRGGIANWAWRTAAILAVVMAGLGAFQLGRNSGGVLPPPVAPPPVEIPESPHPNPLPTGARGPEPVAPPPPVETLPPVEIPPPPVAPPESPRPNLLPKGERGPELVAPSPVEIASTVETLPSSVEVAPPVEAAEPPHPNPPAEAAGTLSINALPWASIVHIVDLTTDQNVPPPSRYTPVALVLPPGGYRVVLKGADSVERTCRVDLGPGATAECLESFVRVKSKAFFARYDRGPGAGPPPGMRPPPGTPRPPPGAPRPPRPEVRPTWLKKMAQAYFDGDYETALTLLRERKSPPKRRNAFYAQLLRGASRHALFLLDGERDTSSSKMAVEDLRLCRLHDPAFVPHPDFFSPRFIEFFSVDAAP